MRRTLSALATLALAAAASAQNYTYTVVDLEPGVNTLTPSKPWSISNDGKTIAGTRGGVAFVWHEGSGFTSLNNLPGYTSGAAFGLDAAGNACGTSTGAANSRAVRYNTNGTVDSLGTLGGASSIGAEMNAGGAIVGDAMNASGLWHAFYWTQAGGMIDLQPGATESHGWDVSDFGAVTGFTGPGGALTTDHAFRWTQAGGFVDLGVPGTFKNSHGFGINKAGQVCGNSQNNTGTVQGWVRYSDGAGWQYLLTNAGKANTAWKLNDFGQVVGETHQDSGGLHRAAVWTDGIGIQDLNALIDPASGWLLRAAYDVNERGQIVGWGEHSGSWHGFRLDPNFFVTYGNACAGGAGHVPALAGHGVPAAGNTIEVMMAEGTPNGVGLIFLSASAGNQPVAGCTYLLGAPLGYPIAFSYDLLRQAHLVATLPTPLAGGASLYLQVASLDPSAPNGQFALSNGLQMILP